MRIPARLAQATGTAILLALGGLAAPVHAAAADYPNKPIQIIYPFPPGSSTELAARTLAKGASDRLGQTVLVVNRAGANGIIGMQAAVKSAPDGYTLVYGTPDTNIIQPLVNAKLPYAPDRELTPIAKISDVFFVLSVNAALPVNNVDELAAYAKGKTLRYATYGPGTLPHVSTELMLGKLGVKMQHIPYQGGAAAALAIARGDVEMNFGGYQNVRPHVQDKKVRLIGIAQEAASDRLPGVLPLKLNGVPYVVSGWNGLFAPRGVSEDIANKLSEVFVAVAETPDFRTALANAGAETTPLKRADFIKFFNAERERFAVVVRENNIKVEE